jgi:predicted aspartyl protease
MRCGWALLCLLATGLLAFQATGAIAASAHCKLIKLAEFPVTLNRGRAVITAKVNGVDARLIVDTGAFFNMLLPDSLPKFGLAAGPAPVGYGVEGATGDASIRIATADHFTIMGFTLSPVDFLVPEHGDVAGTDGMIGENLFSLADAEFDLANGVIRLFRAQGCAKVSLAYWAKDAFSQIDIDRIEKPDYKILGRASVNGHPIRVIFDTGAGASTLITQAATAAGVSLGGTTGQSVHEGGGIGRAKVKTVVAQIGDFTIGDEDIRNTSLRVGDYDFDNADMLIGLDFFMSHRVFVSNSQGKLYFTYNGGPVFKLHDDAEAPTSPPRTP